MQKLFLFAVTVFAFFKYAGFLTLEISNFQVTLSNFMLKFWELLENFERNNLLQFLMKFSYTHSEIWHFRIKYPKAALNHSFLMDLMVFWCFQGIEKGCIGNESVKESFPFCSFLLEDPSVKFQFFNWHLLNSHRNFSVYLFSLFRKQPFLISCWNNISTSKYFHGGMIYVQLSSWLRHSKIGSLFG